MVSAAYADIQSTDVVNGGAGRGDTLTLTTAATALNFIPAAVPANNAQGVTGFEKLVLANGTNTVTLNTAIEVAGTAGAINGEFTHITGGTGYDTIVLGGGAAQNINLTTVTGIEQFDTVAAANAITFSGAAVNGILVNDTGAAGVTMGNFVNTLNYISGGAATITGGNTVDTVNVTAGVAGAITVDGVENVTLTASGAGTSILIANTTAQGVNVTVADSGANATTVTMDANDARADTVTLSTAATATGATTINLDAGDNSVANLATIDTIVNFKAVGADVISFKGGAVASGVYRTIDVTSLDVGVINTKLTSTGVTLGANDILVVTINGSTTEKYAFANTNNAGAGVGVIDAADNVVKLTGTIGSLSDLDFVI